MTQRRTQYNYGVDLLSLQFHAVRSFCACELVLISLQDQEFAATLVAVSLAVAFVTTLTQVERSLLALLVLLTLRHLKALP